MIPIVAIHLDVPMWWVYDPNRKQWAGPVKVCEAVAMCGIRPIALARPTDEDGLRRWIAEGYADRLAAFRLKQLQLLKDKAARDNRRN